MSHVNPVMFLSSSVVPIIVPGCSLAMTSTSSFLRRSMPTVATPTMLVTVYAVPGGSFFGPCMRYASEVGEQNPA